MSMFSRILAGVTDFRNHYVADFHMPTKDHLDQASGMLPCDRLQLGISENCASTER